MSADDDGVTGRTLLEAGRLADARVAFWDGAERADRTDDPTALADAALGLGGIWVHEHRTALERARVAGCSAVRWPASTRQRDRPPPARPSRRRGGLRHG